MRQYSSEDGRFYAIDPLWEKFPSQSPYVYANNNPLGYTDPEGMQAKETGVVESFLHGFFVGGPTLLLNAAVEQGKYLACPPCAWYNQGKDALAVANDPSILSAKLDAVQQHYLLSSWMVSPVQAHTPN